MASRQFSENAVITILGALMFFHIIEFMVMMPLGPNLMRTFDLSAQQFSFLISTYNLTAALAGVLGLFWMDITDRKKILVGVNALFFLGTVACSFANSYHALLMARASTGAFGGMIGALCMTIVGDLVPFERRGVAMSKLMSAFSLAAVAGVPTGLKLASMWTWQAPFMLVAAGSFVAGLAAYVLLPPVTSHLKNGTAGNLSFKDLVPIVNNPDHLRCFLFTAFLMLGQFSVIPFISPSLVKNTGMTEDELPLVYMIGGSLTVITNLIIGRLSDRYSKQLVFKVVSLCSFVPIILITNLGITPIMISLSITSCFFVFISGRMSPAMAIITAVVPPAQRGRFMSLNSAVQQLFAGVGAWLAGSLVHSTATGQLAGFPRVGYIAIGASLFTFFWVNTLKVNKGG